MPLSYFLDPLIAFACVHTPLLSCISASLCSFSIWHSMWASLYRRGTPLVFVDWPIYCQGRVTETEIWRGMWNSLICRGQKLVITLRTQLRALEVQKRETGPRRSSLIHKGSVAKKTRWDVLLQTVRWLHDFMTVCTLSEPLCLEPLLQGRRDLQTLVPPSATEGGGAGVGRASRVCFALGPRACH